MYREVLPLKHIRSVRASELQPCASGHAMQQQMQVTVPLGVGPGQPFQVNTPSGPMQVVCPPDASAGMPMLVNVPQMAAPQPMVMAQAQPMVMAGGETLMMGAPVVQSIAMPTVAAMPVGGVAGGRLLLKVKVDLGGGCEDTKVPQTVPAQVAMIGAADWAYISQLLEDHRKSNGFYACPCIESGIIGSLVQLCDRCVI